MSTTESFLRTGRTIFNMTLLNERRIRNINYYNYVLNVPFKLVDGTVKHHYAIEKNTPLSIMLSHLRQLVSEDFGLEHFEIVPINLRFELGDEINTSINRSQHNLNEILAHEYLSKTPSFYVRPMIEYADILSPMLTEQSQIIETRDCPVCLDSKSSARMNKYFNCEHLLCIDCFTHWNSRRGNNISCPLCRSDFIREI